LVLIGQPTRFFGFKNTHYTLGKSLDQVVTTLSCTSKWFYSGPKLSVYGSSTAGGSNLEHRRSLDASLLVCGGFNGKEFPHCPCAGRKQTGRNLFINMVERERVQKIQIMLEQKRRK
jgi:hypothetical protein